MASYDATINLRVSGTQAVDGVFRRVEQLEGLMRSINARPLDLSKAFGRGDIADRFGAVTGQLNQLKQAFINSERAIEDFNSGSSRTVSNARAIADGFKFIAANSNVASNQFREFTLAATQASAAANVLGRQRLRVLNEELTGVNNADKTIGGRGVVASIISSGRELTNSIAALDAYKGELEDTLKLVEIGSNEFRALEEAIAGVEGRLSTARLSGQKSALGGAAGPSTRLDTVAAFEKRASYAKQIADLEYKQLLTGQQLVKAKLSQSQQDELQNRLAQASEALANGELDVAKRLTVELRNQRILYERANRAQEALMRPTSMTAGAAESITGRRPGGLPPVPGSPAALAAAARAAAAATPTAAPKAATATVDAQVAAQKRLNNLLTSAQILEQRSLEYKAKGLQVDQQVATAQNIINSIQENSNNVTKQYLDALDGVLNSLRNELLLRKAIFNTQKAQTAEANKKPAGGTAAQSAKQGGGAGFQNALIGGAFPLLFGGGAGAVAGGFAGGFIPGNPMMSIVTSAVGTIFDRIIAGSRVAGEAVRTLDTALQHMADSNLFATKDTEFLAKKLEEYGRSSLAAQVVQDELNRKIGIDGVRSLQRLGDSSSELNKSWAEFNLQLQATLAGPLAGLLKWLADAVGVLNQGERSATRVTTIEQGLTPAQKEAFRKERVATLPKGGFGTSPEYEAVFKKYEDVAKKVTDVEMKYSNEQIDQKIALGEKLYTELADLERELNDKKRQYAEQYADMVLALSRQQYDLTEQLQRKAFDTQVQALQQELQLLQKQAEVRIEISRNALRGQQLSAAPGTNLETAILSAVEEYRIRRQEIDNESADRERQFKLEMLKLDVENERYKLDVAKNIQRTNYDNAVKIARINEEINRQNDAVSRKNYERRADIVSAELAVLRSQTIQLHAQANAALQQKDLTDEQINYYTTLRDGLVKALNETVQLQAKKEAGKLFTMPQGIPQMGALPKLSADTTAIDAANVSLQKQIALYQQLLQTQGKLSKEQAAYLDFIAALESAAITPINNIVEAQKEQVRVQQYYTQEIQKGRIIGLAEELAQIEALYQPALKILEVEIERLKIQATRTDLSEKELQIINDTLTAVQDRYDRLSSAAGAATAGAFEKAHPLVRAQEAVTALQGELNNLTDPINAAVTGANAIGSAFQQAFQGLATGTVTAQESLTSFFKAVGEAFVSMAAEIIAKQLVMITLQTILKALGFAGGGGGGGTPSYASGNVATNAFQTNTLGLGPSLGNYNFAGAGFTPFASGGFVTGPTTALIGEGGESEYVIPASKMSAAMSRYAGGARGSSVIPQNGDSMAAGGSPGTFTLETVVINNVEYATVDQVRAMGQSAASQGAQGGFTKSMRTLQNSRSQRSRLGLR